jgi:hypothetical protein
MITSDAFKVINRKSADLSGRMMNSSLHPEEMTTSFMFGQCITTLNQQVSFQVTWLLSRQLPGLHISMASWQVVEVLLIDV